MNNNRISAVLVAMGLFVATTSLTQGASLVFAPNSQQAGIAGSTVTLLIRGTGFNPATVGGEFSVTWDPAKLAYSNLSFSNPPWDTTGLTLIDIAQGSLRRVDVGLGGSPLGTTVGPDFDIASLTLTVLQVLTVDTTVTLGAVSSNPIYWSTVDPDVLIHPTYGSATVSAAVPAPAAVWLMATGLGAIAARARRRRPQGA